MENYYTILGITHGAGPGEVKRAFRERAKKIHPDVAGETAHGEMRKLITAYEVLSDPERRQEYDRAYDRFVKPHNFDYRAFLREQKDDPECQAKLIFFDLLHLEEDEALEIWDAQGGLGFSMEQYLEREDWMDCTFILAEELEKRSRYYESFVLLADLVREERRRPYFRHFMPEVEMFLKELVRLRLRASVDDETYVEAMETLLELGFPRRDEARWMRSMAETLVKMGESGAARAVLQEALQRDPSLSNVVQLRRKLKI
ncbi:J domain-containing protein [Breznakiella homolactica]|uniref:J domain-containing protein n=1 Tax=Breznakiella homolactica TaxID=2798577 RepID=A0A7T7XRP7_9SPIR|nr:J domain-containing protein [Breznakiella homolactica]QQO11235.1 DnaJ domain-containing protein [Breznakiella homolactica]